MHRVPGLGPRRFALLEAAFGDLRTAWEAPPGALRDAGLDTATRDAVARTRAEVTPEQELERLHAAGVRAVCPGWPGYPTRLAEIDDPPPVLYVRGEWQPQDEWAVAVVGTRRATAYGREAARMIAQGLAAHGVTVVSGLARGIDTVAHRAALDAGGRSVAGVANGLDTVYPAENRGLARDLEAQGAVISDYPLGTKPRAEFFPRRNRILSGVSLGTVVVEGAFRSGAMITARYAGEQNRDVFAVPGSIFAPGSEGPLGLIRDGAVPVTRIEDIVEALHLRVAGTQLDLGHAAPHLTATEEVLVAALDGDPRHIDVVVRESGLAASEVSGTLALLELKGVVRNVGGMQYVRVPRKRPPSAARTSTGGAPPESDQPS